MKKITTIFTLLLLCAVTAMAQTTVTVIDKTKAPDTYGSLSGEVFTTNATSGMAGVTISGIKGTTATSFSYGACLALTSTKSGTITIKAPTGCIVESYTLTARSNTSSVPYTLTPSAGGTAVETSTGGITLSASGLTENTASFTYNASSANSFYIPSMTVVIRDPSATYVNITYQVVDKAKNVIFTSEPISTVSGTTITELPEIYKHSWFYDYASVSETADADKIVQVTATPKLFVPFTNFADATWYYVTLRGNKYVRVTSNEPYDTSDTNEETDAYQWAFSGNPYTGGVKMYNKTTGASKTVTKDGNNPVLRDGEYTWEILPNLDGFVLKAPGTANWYINNSNGNKKFGYWDSTNGRTDDGGTFRLTKVPGMEELLPQAKTLLTTLTNGANDVQIGYPTTDALSTFSNAIDAAEAGTLTVDELKAAIAAVKLPANTNYTPRTDVYYTLTNANVSGGNRGSMVYDPSHSDDKDKIYGNEFLWYTTSLNKDDANHQWGFILKDGKYYMYNVGKKQFANVTQGGTYDKNNGDGHTWMFSDGPSAVTLDAGEGNWVATPNVRVRATSEVTGKQYAMSISQSYDGPVIAYDDVNDGGIPMTFAVATMTQDAAVTTAIEALLENLQPYRDALQEAIDAAEAVDFGTKLGQYTTSEAYTTALNNAIAEKAKPDAETSKEDLVAAREALENAIANLQLNMPKANTFLRIKSVAQNGYVSSKTGEEVKPDLAGTAWAAAFTTGGTAEEANTIWLYDGKYLISYATGLYSTGYEADAVGVAAPVTYTFVAATDVMGKYWVKPENTNYWYGGTPTLDYYATPAGKAETRFTLEEVTTLPVKMNVVGTKSYATFYSPVAISQVDGAEVYVVNQTKPNSVVIEEATTQAIPAGKGVMLVSDVKNASATLTIGEAGDFETGLNGVTASEQITKGSDSYNSNLFLSKKGDNIGFYKIKTTNDVGVTGGFKAYLENVTVMNGAKDGFEIEFGGVTGIENMEHGTLNMENGAVYNLQGQKVNKAQKGVFIQNGKKVVLK